MSELVELDLDGTLWDHVFTVAPIVMVGTREPDGSFDLAPKHRVVQLTSTHFGFVCRDSHATYRNAVREGAFTVSWPTPHHIVQVSAAAVPHCADGEKKSMRAMHTIPATKVDGVLLDGCPLYLECELERVVEDLGTDHLVIGHVVAARAEREALRNPEVTDSELVHEHPILGYLHPSQFVEIEKSFGFPFSKGFKRD